ncbi:hypothetical protein M408DRAFT_326942 [Serendipita vermifera MAFF 305830]|uniref:Alpha-ketoglutarate-dependent dioxygenase AlkB-like domain-containing protein n=1 Tax=Serendipita vermifera MAFF 305830 TaxID=933852 RepID=A0A0C2X263_SERVB|nr:hypothetical protein M408DRAFT_326942 [Serendipita vermifera MAFF 305830]
MLRTATKRLFSSAAATPPAGFTYISPFLNRHEQVVLTKAALNHLDGLGTHSARRKLKRALSGGINHDELGFLPEDSCYQFEEGHFDGVIRKFREARITDSQWSSFGDSQLDNIIGRLRSLFPTDATLQFQVLHLASEGEILPHVDNVDASGSVIMGVSLGSGRVLRLEDDHGRRWDQLLEPGSCYIQSGTVRYEYKHSILKAGPLDATSHASRQRLSVMIRDMPIDSRNSSS